MIASDVQPGEGVEIRHPDLVNLYDRGIGAVGPQVARILEAPTRSMQRRGGLLELDLTEVGA